MTGEDKTCPSCGRGVPRDHALCVKCGARLQEAPAPDGPASRSAPRTRQRAIALAVAVAVASGLALLIWALVSEPPKPTRPSTGTARATADAGQSALPTPPPAPVDAGAGPVASRPTPGMRYRAPSTIPLHPPPAGPDAGVGPRGAPRAVPDGSRPGRGFVADLRRCVDAERRTAEDDCATIRRYLGHTAESACLWSRIVRRYWTCLKQKAKRAGTCITGCAARGAACVTGCVSRAERRGGESTTACLLRCWRARIDPCLGGCTRP